MAKVLSKKKDQAASPPANDRRKEQKKQAQQEAKTMLELEQAKKGLKKAEQRLAKAQGRLEVKHTRLHNLEAKLDRLRHLDQQPTDSPVEASLNGQQGEVTLAHMHVAEQEVSPAPIGDRNDIAEEQERENAHQAADEPTPVTQASVSSVPESDTSDSPVDQPAAEVTEVTAQAQAESTNNVPSAHNGDSPEATSAIAPKRKKPTRRPQ